MMGPPRSDALARLRQRFLHSDNTTNENVPWGQISQKDSTKRHGLQFTLVWRTIYRSVFATSIICSGRAGDVVATYALACVDQVVTANNFDIWIGKKRECVPGFLTEIARDFKRDR
jgi:hypothetical protein